LQHRQQIIEVVASVVKEQLGKPEAIRHINRFAQEQTDAAD
jgi:hypothetical protein